MEISASILNIKEENSISCFYRLETAHTDYYHVDVMDGNFVKNDTKELMQKYADSIKNITNIPLDIHLMVEDVKKYVDIFASCEPRIITFHIEKSGIVNEKNQNNIRSKDEILELIKYIKESNCIVGLAINPETNINQILEFLPLIHNVLIMSVNPGKGGQSFIENTTKKIKELKTYIDSNNLDTEIEIDGGINLDNINIINEAGANIAVVGTYLIESKDYKFTINELRNKLK